MTQREDRRKKEGGRASTERSPDDLSSSSSSLVPSKKKLKPAAVWHEAKELVWLHRKRLTLGLVLMLVGRVAGLVLPATSKYLIDDVLAKGRTDLLMPLALAAGVATVIQAVTAFALSQLLGVAAQHAITDMRRKVQAQVMRLPIRYFD